MKKWIITVCLLGLLGGFVVGYSITDGKLQEQELLEQLELKEE